VVHRAVGEIPDPDSEIQTSGIEFIEEPVDGVQAQPDTWGCLAEMGEQRRTQQHLDAVRQSDPEQPIGSPGVEHPVL
jgi:hypothetical protein